jgi:hypothetical protein
MDDWREEDELLEDELLEDEPETSLEVMHFPKGYKTA